MRDLASRPPPTVAALDPPADPRDDLVVDGAAASRPFVGGRYAVAGSPNSDHLVADRDAASPTSTMNWSMAMRPTTGGACRRSHTGPPPEAWRGMPSA